VTTVAKYDTLGYIRVSTEQQATDQKTSLADQRKAITQRATQVGRVLEASAVFEDAGKSGATADGRPAFMAMLAHCQANPRPASNRGKIFVLNDSRFGRFDDPEDATYWRIVFKKLGWLVEFCESDDVQDPVARGVLRFIGSAQASEYRANLKRTAKRSARSTAERGLWQQEAPFGYRRVGTRADGATRVLEIGQRKAQDEESRLTQGPEQEQRAVRWMFESYAGGGLSLGALAREMAIQFPSRKWSRSTVGATLRNPAYTGDVIWCRRVTDKIERLERTVRDRSEWVVTLDAHPPLVTRELFEAVKVRMASNKRLTTATVGGYPLTGLITCDQCGKHFAGGGGKRGPPHDIDRHRFYKDTGGTMRVPVCSPPITTLRKRWLEETVIAAVSRAAADPKVQSLIRAELERVFLSASRSDGDKRAAMESEGKRLLERQKRLVDAITNGTVTEAEARSKLADIRVQISANDSEIHRIQFADRSPISTQEEIERIIANAQNVPAQLKRLSGAALREVIRPWIAKAVIDKKKRLLTLTLWRIPGAETVFQLNNRAAPDSP
jgi:site-specific DNA recombinase